MDIIYNSADSSQYNQAFYCNTFHTPGCWQVSQWINLDLHCYLVIVQIGKIQCSCNLYLREMHLSSKSSWFWKIQNDTDLDNICTCRLWKTQSCIYSYAIFLFFIEFNENYTWHFKAVHALSCRSVDQFICRHRLSWCSQCTPF